jgi:hypothetical protein
VYPLIANEALDRDNPNGWIWVEGTTKAIVDPMSKMLHSKNSLIVVLTIFYIILLMLTSKYLDNLYGLLFY